ncbi:MAG: hypothetical protein KBT87_09895 [Gammaproteobacteria bacterium]|nr:hypothetical protein [Gammaproteobacteria bacterium]MBQ0774973.1 hypothetical protein [Gammaproteobacteria bacterium]
MRSTLWLPCLLLLHACDQAPTPPPSADTQDNATTDAAWVVPEQALNNLLQNEGQQKLRRLSVGATGFGDAINGLLNDTTEERLATAQLAWTRLYQSFNESFVILMCRAAQNPADIARVERADSFPILPGYIDSLKEWPDSGIVNDTALPLTREGLLAQQEATLEGEVSVGFQVLHFLLNGAPDQQRSPLELSALTELSDENIGTLEDQPSNRRRQYLQLASDLLIEDLILLARDDGTPHQVDRNCPVSPLRDTVARLIQLDGLRDNHQVSQEYMAESVRVAANKTLQSSLTPWLNNDSPLYPWLEARALGQNENINPAPALDSKERVKKLQSLHAALTSAQQALRRSTGL